MALAEVMASGDQRAIAACRASYEAGHRRGFTAGFERSFTSAPIGWRPGGRYFPKEERSEEEQAADYQGGPVPSW